MKSPNKTPYSYSFGFAILITTLLLSCEKTKMTPLQGQVVDNNGNAVSSGKAITYVWGEDGKKPKEVVIEFKDGKLSGQVPIGKKYVVNIRAKGFGLVSKVFYDQLPERKYELQQATLLTINPAVGGVISDTQNNCLGSLSFRANWSASPLAGVPLRVNVEGKVSEFGMPADIKAAYDYHAKEARCNNGIQVRIQPNSLTTNNPVTVAMTEVNLFSPDGMPGDNSADFGNGPAFMESFGAFSIDIYDNKKDHNLNGKEGSEAIVILPAKLFGDTTQERLSSIPLLTYDEKSGIWKAEGVALFDKEANAYVARVSHFSAINFDLEKNDPACLRFNDKEADSFDPPYRVELTVVPTGGTLPTVANRPITASDLCAASAAPFNRQFALTRLPQNKNATVVFYDPSTTPATPKAVYVVKTPATDPIITGMTHPNCTELTVPSPLVCGNFTLIDMSQFTGTDIIVAACREAVTNDLIISIASKTTINPANFKLRLADVSCAGIHLLNTLTLIESTTISPPIVNFQLLKYRIPSCTATGADQSVEILNTSDALVSNPFYVTSCTL